MAEAPSNWVSFCAVTLMLKAIHAQESLEAARRKATEVVARLCELRLAKAAELVETAAPGTLAYYAFPEERHRAQLARRHMAEDIATPPRRGHAGSTGPTGAPTRSRTFSSKEGLAPENRRTATRKEASMPRMKTERGPSGSLAAALPRAARSTRI